MSETNGTHHPPAESTDQVRLLEGEVQRLARQLHETYYSPGYGYAALMTRLSDLWNNPRSAISQPGDRRGGKDWPVIQNETELGILQADSYWRTKTNAQAKSLLRAMTNYAIGTGPIFTVSIKKDLPLPDTDQNTPGKQLPKWVYRLKAKVQKRVDEFVKRNNFAQQCREAYWRRPRDGEAILRYFLPDGKNVTTRFIEPEQIRNPPGYSELDGWTFGMRHFVDYEMGVEDVATILEYHIVPKNSMLGGTGEFVDAEKIWHYKGMYHDSNVKRGIPEFVFQTGEAFDRIHILQRNASIGEAARQAVIAVTQYAYANQSQIDTAIGNQSNRTEQSLFDVDRQKQVEDLEPGQHWHVPAGQEFVNLPAASGTSLAQQILGGDKQAAVSGFNAPNYFLGETGGETFASVKEHGAPFIRTSEANQRYDEERFVEPVLFQIRKDVENGLLPEYTLELLDLVCELPRIIQRDPLQQTQRNNMRMADKTMSPQMAIRDEGDDPDDVIRDWADWMKQMGQMQQPQPPVPGGGPDSESPQAIPESEDDDFQQQWDAYQRDMESGLDTQPNDPPDDQPEPPAPPAGPSSPFGLDAKDLAKSIFKGQASDLGTKIGGYEGGVAVQDEGREVTFLFKPDKKSVYIDFQFSDPARKGYQSTGKQLQTGSVNFLHKFKQFAINAAKKGIGIEYLPSDSRRAKIYAKLLTSLGFQKDDTEAFIDRWVPKQTSFAESILSLEHTLYVLLEVAQETIRGDSALSRHLMEQVLEAEAEGDEGPRLARDVPDEGEEEEHPFLDDPDLWPEFYESDLFTDEEREAMGRLRDRREVKEDTGDMPDMSTDIPDQLPQQETHTPQPVEQPQADRPRLARDVKPKWVRTHEDLQQVEPGKSWEEVKTRAGNTAWQNPYTGERVYRQSATQIDPLEHARQDVGRWDADPYVHIPTSYGEDVVNHMKTLAFPGKEATKEDFHQLIGSPRGVTTTIRKGESPLEVHIDADGHFGEISRTLKITPDGDTVVNNNLFKIPKKLQGSGAGGKVLANQVQESVNHGFDRIETLAARGDGYIGYKVWPALGYDAELSDEQMEQLQRNKKLPDTVKNAKTVLDLYETPEGRKWWIKHGDSTHMTFDLTPGSRSLEVLNRSRAKRGLPEIAPPDNYEEIKQQRKEHAQQMLSQANDVGIKQVKQKYANFADDLKVDKEFADVLVAVYGGPEADKKYTDLEKGYKLAKAQLQSDYLQQYDGLDLKLANFSGGKIKRNDLHRLAATNLQNYISTMGVTSNGMYDPNSFLFKRHMGSAYRDAYEQLKEKSSVRSTAAESPTTSTDDDDKDPWFESEQRVADLLLEHATEAKAVGNDADALFFLEEWMSYQGPRGGKGWQDSETGRVIYGDKPGERTRQKQKIQNQARLSLQKVAVGESLSTEELRYLAANMGKLTKDDLKGALWQMEAKGYSKLAKAALKSRVWASGAGRVDLTPQYGLAESEFDAPDLDMPTE